MPHFIFGDQLRIVVQIESKAAASHQDSSLIGGGDDKEFTLHSLQFAEPERRLAERLCCTEAHSHI
jgi:hypothetical protein